MPRSQPTSRRVAGLQFVTAASPPVTTTPTAAETNSRGRDRTMRNSKGGRRISRFPVCIAFASRMRQRRDPLSSTRHLMTRIVQDAPGIVPGVRPLLQQHVTVHYGVLDPLRVLPDQPSDVWV